MTSCDQRTLMALDPCGLIPTSRDSQLLLQLSQVLSCIKSKQLCSTFPGLSPSFCPPSLKPPKLRPPPQFPPGEFLGVASPGRRHGLRVVRSTFGRPNPGSVICTVDGSPSGSVGFSRRHLWWEVLQDVGRPLGVPKP